MDQYELLEKLGEGTFGIVRSAKRKTDGKCFAVKISKTDSDGIAATTLREVSNLRNVKGHPYIVGLEAVYLKPDSICMVLELCSKDLAKFIRSHVEQKIPKILIVKFTRQIIDAVAHCHSINIVHRDIKPQNILVDVETEKVKLADFGLTRQTLMKSPMTPEVITLWYRAPDLLLGRAYDWSIDMWSLGCVLGEMATGRPLFPGDSEIDTLFRIFRCVVVYNAILVRPFDHPFLPLTTDCWELPKTVTSSHCQNGRAPFHSLQDRIYDPCSLND